MIGDCDLSRNRLLIAEIGNNHEGDASVAYDLVEAAAEAGADAVKVQVINPERLVHCSQTARIDQLSRFRLPMSAFERMADLATRKGMLFMASAFDLQSLEQIEPLVSAIKIASGDLDFTPLLEKAAGTGKPLILSTGMATLDEVKSAVAAIARNLSGSQRIDESLALLHCVSLYPAPLAYANLRAIETLRDKLHLVVGYSDHTLGIESALLALGLGARIIEKHFTLDKNLSSFRDHQLSADPAELKRLAEITHLYESILGNGNVDPSQAEKESAAVARRSIVAAHDLEPGTTLTAEDLDYVRPRNGLAPAEAKALLGRRIMVPLKRHDTILHTHAA